jgi:uncharacterized protein DUF2726
LAWWVLVPLVPIGAVAFVVWAYRKKAVTQARASSERFQQIFGASVPGATRAGAIASNGTAARRQPVPGAASTSLTPKARLLSDAETLLFYVLKTGLPDHETFAHVSLAAVIDVGAALPGNERERQRRRLSQHHLDFVVCDKNLKPVAVLEIEQDLATSAVAQFKAESVKASGIKYLRISPAAIPQRHELRALIYGDPV